MAVMALKEQLDSFVKSMLAEGMLDQQFQQLQMLEDGSGFVAEVIKMFCDDSERILAELTNLLEKIVVDFGKVDGCVHQLKGSSAREELYQFGIRALRSFDRDEPRTELEQRQFPMGVSRRTTTSNGRGTIPHTRSIGAQKVTMACVQFRQFCDENDKAGCLRALNVLKHEFYHLQSQFHTMSQLENRILAYEGRKVNGM